MRVGEVGAQHVEAGVGEIQHAHHAEDQRQAGASMNSSRPELRPFSSEIRESGPRGAMVAAIASYETGPGGAALGGPGRLMRIGAQARRPLHLARGRRARHVGLVGLHRLEVVAGVLDAVVGVLGVGLRQLGDVQRLLQLVVGLAHLDVAVEALELDAFHRRGHLHRVGALGLAMTPRTASPDACRSRPV